MRLSSYLYVNRGVDHDLPFKEVIKSALTFCDEVVVGTDPRFKDSTIKDLKDINSDKLILIIKEFDFNVTKPHAEIKNLLRKQCSGDWLLELDADKFIDKDSGKILYNKLLDVNDGVYIISLGTLPFFNGNNVKLFNGTENNPNNYLITQDCITRNLDTIQHGGLERFGAGYISSLGNPISSGYSFCSFNWKAPKEDDVRIYHYGWYNLPRRWQMKLTHHYYEGRLKGTYKNVDDYKLNLDSEPVNFWDIPQQKSFRIYKEDIIGEMRHPGIYKCKLEHPKDMQFWINKQENMIVKKSNFELLQKIIGHFKK